MLCHASGYRCPLHGCAYWIRTSSSGVRARTNRTGPSESWATTSCVLSSRVDRSTQASRDHSFKSFPSACPSSGQILRRVPWKNSKLQCFLLITAPLTVTHRRRFARETRLLDILRDSLGDDLSTPDLATRELALDKTLIQLIQHACKSDRLARALDLVRLLHHTPSFDAAAKIAGFYHLIGLQEKVALLKDDREDADRLEGHRDRRRQAQSDFAPVPAMRLPTANTGGASRPKPFQDFRPPPALHRPGLERATPAAPAAGSSQTTEDSTVFNGSSFADSTQDDYAWQSPAGRKRPADDEPVRETRSPGLGSGAKRRAVGESASTATRSGAPPPRECRCSSPGLTCVLTHRPNAAGSNPFARKPAADANSRNPFARGADANKSLHKSESFFNKVDAAEAADKGKRGAGKGREREREKKDAGRQTTLFGLPAVQPAEKEKKGAGGRKKNVKAAAEAESQNSGKGQETQTDTQITDVAVDESQAETLANGDTQVDEEQTQLEETQVDNDMDTEVHSLVLGEICATSSEPPRILGTD